MTLEEAQNLKPGTVIGGLWGPTEYRITKSKLRDEILCWCTNDGRDFPYSNNINRIHIVSTPEPVINNNYEIF